MTGKLYGVGVGPGDPELLTLKAVRLIKECDVIGIPGESAEKSVAYQIAKKACPDIEKKEHIQFETPMTKDKALLEESYRKAADDVEALLDSGKDVAILTLGDPTIYSTYIYLHRIVRGDGYDADIVNGVPSFCAVSARLGDSLVDRDEQLHIIPASYQNEEAMNLSGSRIFMKAGSKYSDLREQLKRKNCKTAMIENCGMDDEKIYDDLKQFPEKASYFSIIIVKDAEDD